MYKTILVATDGTDFCNRAIEQAVRLGQAFGAKVIGITVVQPLHTGTPQGILPENLVATVTEQQDKIASESLKSFVQSAQAGKVVFETVKQKDDHPWEAILRTAKQKGCDLVVMASHGRRGIGALVLGSETQKVLTHATMPVLVVK
jgi:nucleotide-binding universal stress UspA family protein